MQAEPTCFETLLEILFGVIVIVFALIILL